LWDARNPRTTIPYPLLCASLRLCVRSSGNKVLTSKTFLDFSLEKAHTDLMKAIYLLLIALTLGACATREKKVVEEFIVDFDSPRIEIGEIEMQFDRLFSIGGLRKAIVPVSYCPQEDAVCLRYKSELTTYYQFWSMDGRSAFISSLAQYNEDYNERILDRKIKKTKSKQKYGTVKGYLIWQLHRLAIKAMANMDVELGYAFYDRSPYFTINQREAVFTSSSRSENRDTQNITMFLTRAQADELAALFDQEFLDGLDTPGRPLTPGIGRDEY